MSRVAAAAPCRLFVYLARDAPVGVIIRRGPSDWVRLSRWQTDVDTIQHGQWMHARVYERRCDLSPNGELFVAFVRGRPEEPGPNRDTWIALSRPPWFSALAHWVVGGTYCAGGFFPASNVLWLGFDPEPTDRGKLPAWPRRAPVTSVVPDGTGDWTDRTVWHNRPRRDGWRSEDERRLVWTRPHPTRPLSLTMTIDPFAGFDQFGGRYRIGYAVRDAADAALLAVDGATWADWDQRGRLALARDGILSVWEPEMDWRQLADFNEQAPEPEPAPPEASVWPKRPTARPKRTKL